MRNVLKAIILGSCMMPSPLLATTPQIQNVTAEMLPYPWYAACNITYTVVGDIAAPYPDRIELIITATDKETGESYVSDPSALSGDTGTEKGAHHVVWDLNKQGVNLNSKQVVFTVMYERQHPLYCVIDISSGANAASYPVSYLMDVPSSGWTVEYKTTKLVLRRIEPGPIPTRDEEITKPFYIGVFEVTQQQYGLVMGSNPSLFTLNGAVRPVDSVSYYRIRGSYYSASATDNSFMGRLRAKTGIEEFDLPTEAQWEYACRAGTTSKYNNGGDSENDLQLLGRYGGGSNIGHSAVGSYLPNAWGLYDMHGNVLEWCLDRYDVYGGYALRGGCWNYNASGCTSSSRERAYDQESYEFYGFRLVRTLLE